MNDIWTMIWKETKDSIFSGGRGAWIRPLIFIFLLGMLTPWQLGQRWLALSSTPIAVLVACYLPFFFITSYIGDAIAGERERHTLETLLASRISDQAILWGKVVVTVGYNFGLTIIGLLIGFVVANLPQGQGNWTFYYPLDILGETLVIKPAYQPGCSQWRCIDLLAGRNRPPGSADHVGRRSGTVHRHCLCPQSYPGRCAPVVEYFPIPSAPYRWIFRTGSDFDFDPGSQLPTLSLDLELGFPDPGNGGRRNSYQPPGLRNDREIHHSQYGGAGRAGRVDW